jgi:hypothetical protein
MTLVLTCMAPEFGIQVSDKRITCGGALLDDSQNKGIQYFNQMVFAYSGIAKIGGESTDVWFAKAMKGHDDLATGLVAVRDQLTAEFGRMVLSPIDKRHAFIGVGWGRLEKGADISPVVLRLTNALEEDGSWREKADPAFELTSHEVEVGKHTRLMSLGATVPEYLFKSTARIVERGITRGANQYAIIRLLAGVIRRVASSNNTVGKTLLAMVVPKKRCDAPELTNSSPPIGYRTPITQPMFFHIAEGSQALKQTFPTGIGPGGFLLLGGSLTKYVALSDKPS